MYTKANSMPSVPIITPPGTPNYEVPQSKYEQVPRLPIRALLLGASGSGKCVLPYNLIMDVYDKVSLLYIYGHQLLMLILTGLKLKSISMIN